MTVLRVCAATRKKIKSFTRLLYFGCFCSCCLLLSFSQLFYRWCRSTLHSSILLPALSSPPLHLSPPFFPVCCVYLFSVHSWLPVSWSRRLIILRQIHHRVCARPTLGYTEATLAVCGCVSVCACVCLPSCPAVPNQMG